MPKKKTSRKLKASDILGIIGGIIAIIDGILNIIGSTLLPLASLNLPSFSSAISSTIGGVIIIIIGLIILASTGVISGFSIKVKTSWLIYLIFAIVVYIFGSALSALLLILATIIALFKY
ncbi:MAG: hypothetical protein ACP6IS_07730 [Candidatus Asgardarchaeia archaeon]